MVLHHNNMVFGGMRSIQPALLLWLVIGAFAADVRRQLDDPSSSDSPQANTTSEGCIPAGPIAMTTDVTGGLLYTYTTGGDARSIEDLAVLARAHGCTPHKRPHMVRPNRASAVHTHVLVPYPSTGGIHVVDVATRTLVACFDTAEYGAGQLHDALWAPDDSYFVGVDMGGQVHKFSADLEQGAFAHTDTFDTSPYLSALGTSSGPKPISLVVTANGLMYVTMAHGGALVLRANGATAPITHVHTYSSSALAGTGGLWADELPGGNVVLEYGTQTEGALSYVHQLDSVEAAAGTFASIKSVAVPGSDAHGLTTCVAASGERLLLVTNRLSADVQVVHLATMRVVANASLATPDHPAIATDYAQYHAGKLYVAWRGPVPLSALKTSNPLWTPGTAIYDVSADCRSMAFERVMLTHTDLMMEGGGISDIHGLSIVHTADGPQLWAIDQAATRMNDLAGFLAEWQSGAAALANGAAALANGAPASAAGLTGVAAAARGPPRDEHRISGPPIITQPVVRGATPGDDRRQQFYFPLNAYHYTSPRGGPHVE